MFSLIFCIKKLSELLVSSLSIVIKGFFDMFISHIFALFKLSLLPKLEAESTFYK